MRVTSAYRGVLVLPDGAKILPGETAAMADDLAKNAGVAEWIADGWLVPEAKPAKKADK